MFCSECGRKATGKFCSACGHQLAANLPADASVDESIVLALDWSNMVEYEALLRVPEVRDRIARSAAQSKKSMTGEEFLETCGKALETLAGVPVALPMTSIAQFAQKTYGKMGVRTGKSRQIFIAKPVGSVLVSLLCLLARTGRAIREVNQMTDGCILTAALPSDVFSLEGDLIVAVGQTEGGTHVDAKTEIKGQLFDWGKSTRCLETMITELAAA